MAQHPRAWEFTILEGRPEGVEDLGSLVIGDIDGDGQEEVVSGGTGALLWHRPATHESGTIATGNFGVGLVIADLDRDGAPEVIVAEEGTETEGPWRIISYHFGERWRRTVIGAACDGQAHDLVVVDIDGDGEEELVANAAYCSRPGVYIYKRSGDGSWTRHTVDTGYFAEGLSIGDVDGDGRLEIVHGPYLYYPPAEGPYAGPWRRTVVAANLRQMCRTALLDITGSGRPDIVIAESEYLEGRLVWYENRLAAGGDWVEHEIERGLVYAHSLDVWREGDEAGVFVAEMARGGWSAPWNWNARLLTYTTRKGGKAWNREVVSAGTGTHQAVRHDLDGDGQAEIVGKAWQVPQFHIWRPVAAPSRLLRVRHTMLDRDKPYTATDIFAADVDGDGRADVVCGAWWYRNPTWERFTIPGINQALLAYDLDGDGRVEIIATKARPGGEDGYGRLCSDLWWLKPVDPANGVWEEYPIGMGRGDWPHGTLVAPLLPGGKLALVVGYHNAASGDRPELFELPDDARSGPWPARRLADIAYGEEYVAHDVTGNGLLDLIAGPYWLENLGDGDFEPHRLIAEDLDVARVRVGDINGDGRAEVVFVEEKLDFKTREAGGGVVAYLEPPADPRSGPWPMRVIDRVRSPHSLSLADLDGDGKLEIVCAEHDPFWSYRTRSRLCVYKRADPRGRSWTRHVLDDRFEHHDGAQVFEVAPGRFGIISHGWTDSIYVHLWEFI